MIRKIKNDSVTNMPRQNCRVCVFAAHFHPHVGGIEAFNEALWPRLIERGWRVQLITCLTVDAPREEIYKGIKVSRIPSLNFLQGKWPVPYFKDMVRTLRSLNSASPRFDCFITNGRFYILSFLAARFAKRKGIPHVHFEHGSTYKLSSSRVVNVCCLLFDATLGKYIIRASSICAAVSRAAADYCKWLGAKEVPIVYNAIDTCAFMSASPNRRDWGLDDSQVAFLLAGRLIEPKGIRDYVTAANLCPVDNAVYLIAGDGPLRDYVMAASKFSPKIRYLGAVPHSRMPQLLRSVDVVCHPSLCPEGLPTVILEAGAAGCAVVATPAGGTLDIISSPDEGIIVPARNPSELARAMTYLAQDPSRIRNLGACLQRKVRQVFDIEVTASRVAALIESLQRHDVKTQGTTASALEDGHC